MRNREYKHTSYSPRAELYRIMGGATVALALSVTFMTATPALAVTHDTASASVGAVAAETLPDAVSNPSGAVQAPKNDESSISSATDSIDSRTMAEEKSQSDAAEAQPANVSPTQSVDNSVDANGSNNVCPVAKTGEAEGKDASIEAKSAQEKADDSSSRSNGLDSYNQDDVLAEAKPMKAQMAPQVSYANSTASQEQTTLDGIDVASYQQGIQPANVPADFVIVKATQGDWYKSPCYKEQADGALAAGKLLGFYHFAEAGSSAKSQAEYFVNAISPYIGKAILCLDWENTSGSDVYSKGTTFCKEWLDEVYALTGVRGYIYASKDAIRTHDFSNVAADYKLWCAQYPDMKDHNGYQNDPWTDSKGFGAWSSPTIYQYSSTTRLKGWNGYLDVNKFYGTRADWLNDASSLLNFVTEHKQDVADGTYLIRTSLGDRAVLDVASGSTANGGNVQIYQGNMTGAQKWRVAHTSEGYVVLTNAGSGKVLDVRNGNRTSGANVQQWTSNGTLAQRWVFVLDRQTGLYKIVSALSPSLVLDVSGGSGSNGTNVQLYWDNGTKAQRFEMVSLNPTVASSDEIKRGYYNIVAAVDGSHVIDVTSDSDANGTNLQLYENNHTFAQSFQFVKVGEYYRIVSNGTDNSIDAAEGSPLVGTNAQLWNSWDTNNQLFSAHRNSDGSYTFTNVATGLVLDVSGGGTSNGTNIWLYKPNGTASQRFFLRDFVVLQNGTYEIGTSLDASKRLDVANGSLANGGNVQNYESNGTAAQQWVVTLTGGSDYEMRIKSRKSGLYLGEQSNGNVAQTTNNGARSLWRIVGVSKGAVMMQNVATGDVLDLASANTANWAKVQGYQRNDTRAQYWYFRKK